MADKYLIINADDFGMCGAANEAVMDLFKSGRLKSSTIMMPCKFAKEAVQFSIDNPQYAIGVHLIMTADRAVCDCIAGMTDKYAVEKYGQAFIPLAWAVKG